MEIIPGSTLEFDQIPENEEILFIPDNSLYFAVMMKISKNSAIHVCMVTDLEDKGGKALPDRSRLEDHQPKKIFPFILTRILGPLPEVRKSPPKKKSNLVYIEDYLIF